MVEQTSRSSIHAACRRGFMTSTGLRRIQQDHSLELRICDSSHVTIGARLSILFESEIQDSTLKDDVETALIPRISRQTTAVLVLLTSAISLLGCSAQEEDCLSLFRSATAGEITKSSLSDPHLADSCRKAVMESPKDTSLRNIAGFIEFAHGRDRAGIEHLSIVENSSDAGELLALAYGYFQ